MSINFTVLSRKLVIVLLFCTTNAPLYSVAQTQLSTPGGYTSDRRRLADLNLADLQSEAAQGYKADNRVLKNLLWSVQRNATAADVKRFDSLYSQFKLASENGMARIHDSIRADYSPEVLESLWQQTRAMLIARYPNSCAKVF